jgi:hypothetical protein
MNLSIETWIVGFGLFLVIWYFGASVYNRRRGLAIYHWIMSGLDDFGGEVSGKWLGSSGSGAQLHVHGAAPPFKTLDIIYLLTSRELLPLFLVDLMRGKRDQLIIKTEIRPHFIGEVEVLPEKSSLTRQMQSEQNKPWTINTLSHQLISGLRGSDGSKLQQALEPFAEKYGANIRRISWGRKAPHLIIMLSLTGLFDKDGSASALYADLKTIVDQIA